jgi:hypothetical protein
VSVSLTSPAARSTRRCRLTAGRLIAKRPAIWPADSGPSRSISRMLRRTGSAIAAATSSTPKA